MHLTSPDIARGSSCSYPLDTTRRIRCWKFTYTRDVVPSGHPVPASEIAGKSGDRQGTGYDSHPVPCRSPSLASQEAAGPDGPDGPDAYIGEKNFSAAKNDHATLVNVLVDGWKGMDKASLMAALGWDEPRFSAIKADLVAAGVIIFQDGGWHVVEGNP